MPQGIPATQAQSKRIANTRQCRAIRLLFVCSLLMPPISAHAQEIQFGDTAPAQGLHAQRVMLDTDALSVPANKAEWVEVRFHVAPGFHINSHNPHDELLIPTALKLGPAPQIRVTADEYPSGLPLHLNIGSGETLSTYQGEFRVRLQLVAQRGDWVLTGALHYQACDAASCFPPRDLPIRIALQSK